MKVLKSIFWLLKICLSNKAGKIGLGIYIFVFLLNLIGLKISVELINWNVKFYNAIEQRDALIALKQVGLFVVLIFFSSLIYLSATYCQKLLQIRWREVLTQKALNLWLKEKKYFYLGNSNIKDLDNPDQRIAEDCKIFIEQFISTTLGLLNNCIGLTTYVVVLWNVATYTLSFKIFGLQISLPHYMVWAAPIYVLISSLLTHYLGSPLIKLNAKQRQVEADFRFSLTRFREAKDNIALQNGEEVEREIFDDRFSKIKINWNKIIKRDFILGTFTRPYFMTILRIPIFLALPAYFFGGFALGAMMKMASAFSSVATSLSWFIFSYRDLAELSASSVRFANFLKAAEDFEIQKKEMPKEGCSLKIEKLNLFSLADKELFSLEKEEWKKGDTIFIRGNSGLGKTTLFRTIAGLHHNFNGTLKIPDEKMIFLTQKAYFPIGGLLNAVVYPNKFKDEDLEKVKELLRKVNFNEELIEKNLFDCELEKLSGGEQQRLVLARVLFSKPDWIFMDESTNALDFEAEKFLITLLRKELPEATIIVISHSDYMNSYVEDFKEIKLNKKVNHE